MLAQDSSQKRNAFLIGGLLIIGGLYFLYQNNSSSFSDVIATLTGESAATPSAGDSTISKNMQEYQNGSLRPTKVDEVEVLLQKTAEPRAADTTSGTTSYSLQLRPPENQNLGSISEVSLELTILGAKNISTKQVTSSTTSVTTSKNGKVTQNTSNQTSNVSWSTKTETVNNEQQTTISISVFGDGRTFENLENGFLEIGVITVEPADPETAPEFFVTTSEVYTTEGEPIEVNLVIDR